MKVAIIGNPGSGKSTLALKLHHIFGIPLYHIDQYFWKPGWQRPDLAEFEKVHQQLCDQETWIIEGMAMRFFEYRLQKADIVIFLDVPTYRCLYRICKRAFIYFGRVYFSSALGCPEGIPDFQLLKYVWNFEKEKKPEIERLLQQHKDEKKVFVIKNPVDLKNLLKYFKLH